MNVIFDSLHDEAHFFGQISSYWWEEGPSGHNGLAK